ncbi:MAG: trigger factor [Oscillospiraceae bacterium]|nr:trigger factor [Oscillospiraceae bacterium]
MEIVSQNNTATNTYAVEFKFSAEEFEAAISTAYNQQKSKITVPGFRKGKAPRKVIETHYGANVFFEDAVNYLYNHNIEEIVEKTGLDVIDVQNTDVTDVSKENGVSMKADFITKPEVEISDYKGIKVKKTVKTVTDEVVDEEINKMREKVARIVTVEGRAVQEGDTAVIDFEGFVDDVAFEGGKGEKFPLEIGSHTFIPGFEEQIIGKNVGDDFDVNVTFPEDYQAENLKGKPAVFKCKLHEIKAKDMPELDDDFVKDVSEKDTVDELKAEIREKLEKQYADEAADAADNALMDEMLGKMKAEIPEVMYERRIDEIAREWVSRTRIDIKDYLKYTGMTMGQFRANFREPAKRQVELRLALAKIADLENVVVSQEDLDKEYADLAEQYKMEVEQVKAAIPVDTLTTDIKIEKALEIVKDSADIEEVKE